MKTREKNASGAASIIAWASPRRKRTLETWLALDPGKRRDDAIQKRLATDNRDRRDWPSPDL